MLLIVLFLFLSFMPNND